MMTHKIWLSITALALASAASAEHPRIDSFGQSDTIGIIAIEGEIKKGDAKELARHLENFPKGFVILAPKGGDNDEARQIAHMISKGPYVTVSPNYIDCKGICALIWLAGSSRVIEPGATVQITKETISPRDQNRLKLEGSEKLAIRNLGDGQLVLRGNEENSNPIAFSTATISDLLEGEKGGPLIEEAMEKKFRITLLINPDAQPAIRSLKIPD